ncbi:MAG TPA: caspase family protein, partial [Ilumatobacteraceae bacterium]|nr:caspase family protein [Ilumatobacteraceae bacterium]
MTIHALLVAIDAYDPPINPLFGCRNDMAALEAYLHARAGDELRPLVLQDGEATRDSVTAAFRDHLGAAGPGDVALFAFFGHGSEEPAPAELARAESTGRLQTILLHDCGRRVGGKLRRALADKELALLIAEVAARGPHVVTILDCCHAGGGTRDPFARPRSWRPLVDAVDVADRDVAVELAAARPVTEFLPGTLDQWSAPRAPHVALGACRSDELAKEHSVGDVTRGAFSVALVESLDVLGTRTTYRSLLASVRARVERTAADQRPQLEPLDVGGLGDRLFLDGSVVPVSPTFTVALGADGWEVDGGLVHGFRDPVGDEAFELACSDDDGTVAGVVRVRRVEIGRSLVEPVAWEPADRAYRAVVVAVPLPPAEVQLDPPTDGGPAAADVEAVHRAVRAAVATAGPGGTPSTSVRVVDATTASPGALRLRVDVPQPGTARITRADGSPVVGDVAAADGAGARLVVSRLEHLAAWEL